MKRRSSPSLPLPLPLEWIAAAVFLVAGLAFSSAWASTPPALRGDSLVRQNQALLEASLVQGLKGQIASRMGQPEQVFDVKLETLRLEPALADGIKLIGAQIMGLGSAGSKRLDGLFQIAVQLNTDKGVFDHSAIGVMRVTGPVYVAKASLTRGHIVTENDLQMLTLPWSRLPNGAAATGLGALLGQRVTSGIPVGEVVYGALLDAPLDVRSGDLVEVTVLSGPGVIIRSRAKAQQEGRKGDLVRLLQPDTKKTLTGVITGSRTVEIRL